MSMIKKAIEQGKQVLNYCARERSRFVIATICLLVFFGIGVVENNMLMIKTVQGEVTVANQSLIERQNREAKEGQGNVDIFILPDCVHCHHQMEYIRNNNLEQKFPELNFRTFNLAENKNRSLLREKILRAGIQGDRVGTPLTFLGENYLMGFNADELLKALENYATEIRAKNQRADAQTSAVVVPAGSEATTIEQTANAVNLRMTMANPQQADMATQESPQL